MHYSADRIIGQILKNNFPCVDADTARDPEDVY
jgi:hypothetical protein